MLQLNQEHFWRPYCCVPYIIAHKPSNSAANAQQSGYTQSEVCELLACLICNLFPSSPQATQSFSLFSYSESGSAYCFQDACRYGRSQFSNANSSASFFELFARSLSSFPPLLPRVTAVGRNRTPWETVPYFHFLASFCVLEWEELQPHVFRHCPGWLFCISCSLEIHPGAVRRVRILIHPNGFPRESNITSLKI